MQPGKQNIFKTKVPYTSRTFTLCLVEEEVVGKEEKRAEFLRKWISRLFDTSEKRK